MAQLMHHYCSTKAFYDIVTSKTIWLSDFRATNDQMEGRWADSLLSLPDGVPCIEKVRPAFSLERHSAFRSPTYVGCFSLDHDLLSQWRGYSDDGKGVAIGFRPDLVAARPPFEPGRNWDEFELTTVDVVYDRYTQGIRLHMLVENYIEKCRGTLEDEWTAPGHTLLMELDHLRASMKNPGFQEERERRIIFKPQRYQRKEGRLLLGKRNPLQLQVRATDDRLVGYVALPLPDDSIKRLVLGPKNLSDDDTVNPFLGVNGFTEAEIIRSQISYG